MNYEQAATLNGQKWLLPPHTEQWFGKQTNISHSLQCLTLLAGRQEEHPACKN